jgi:hypothetical protein
MDAKEILEAFPELTTEEALEIANIMKVNELADLARESDPDYGAKG